MQVSWVRLAVVFGLVGAFAAALVVSSPITSGPGGDDTNTGIEPTWPMLGASRIRLADVPTVAGLPARRPHDPLADDATINTIWAMPGGEQIVYQYESGIEVNIQDGHWITESWPSAEAFFIERAQGFTEEFGVSITDMLAVVNGQTALVIPQNFLGQSNKGSVSFLLPAGIFVRVYGHFDRDTLLRIAESVG